MTNNFGYHTSHRSKLEMYRQILETAKNIIRPTRLMHRVNMDWDQMKRHLSKLIQRGLIENSTYGSRKFYKTTEKGLQTLNKIEALKEDLQL